MRVVYLALLSLFGLLAQDSFVRPNGGLGANWTATTTGTMAIVGNKVEANAITTSSHAYYSAVSFPNNQYSQISIAVQNSANCINGAQVRLSGAADVDNFYEIGTTGAVGAGSTLRLAKNVSGAFTVLATYTITLTIGDTIGISAVGSTISAYHDSILIGSVTDSSIASGNPGISEYIVSGATTDCALNNWSGGQVNIASAAPVSAGVEAGRSGANAILVSSADGTTPVYLIGMGVQGGEFGLTYIQAIANVTSPQWGTAFQTWYTWLQGNQSTAIANTYAKFNTVRLYINSAAYEGIAGADPGGNGGNPSVSTLYSLVGTNSSGHLIYCAGTPGTCGLGTTDGTETAGSGSVYQAAIDTIITNVLGASTTLGYTTYIVLNDDYTTPQLASNGQKLLPSSQPATMSPVDLAMWTALAVKYKNNQRVIFEFQNEPYYSAEGTGGTSLMNYEAALLGNGNGSPTTFTWPNATSIGFGGTSCYYVNFGTCIVQGGSGTVVSYQQVLNAIRAQGATNLVFLGTLVNSGGIFNWSQNGGTQSVTDPYTVAGHQQYAAILHSYNYPGSATFSNGKTGAQNISGLIAADTPFVLDEFGTATTVGSTGANGYSWMKANAVSGHMMTAWANFASPGTSITNIYNQGSFCMTCLNPWSNFNVPNPSSAASQVPNGSN